jgi:hypothetical protein
VNDEAIYYIAPISWSGKVKPLSKQAYWRMQAISWALAFPAFVVEVAVFQYFGFVYNLPLILLAIISPP